MAPRARREVDPVDARKRSRECVVERGHAHGGDEDLRGVPIEPHGKCRVSPRRLPIAPANRPADQHGRGARRQRREDAHRRLGARRPGGDGEAQGRHGALLIDDGGPDGDLGGRDRERR